MFIVYTYTNGQFFFLTDIEEDGTAVFGQDQDKARRMGKGLANLAVGNIKTFHRIPCRTHRIG